MANWSQYFCNVNDKLSSILVDLDLIESLPNSRTELIWIWVYMKAPRPDGLSSNEEFETLNAIEDALTQRLEQECDACIAGRITGDGRREFYYYGHKPSNLERLVKEELANFSKLFSKYRFECDTQPDPEWRQYLDVLFPAAENYECIKNMAVLQQLATAGDEPDIIRPIWHYVFFDADEAKKGFVEWARSNEFEITDRGRSDAPGKLDPGMVCIVRSHTTTPDDIDANVIQVFRAAKQFGGAYDGWETRVEKRGR
jgi:uncharacterized protein (TIGR01619 family)